MPVTSLPLLKRLRAWPPLNRPATTALRAATRRRGVPAPLVDRLPRQGVVTIDVPGGEPIRLWSGDDWISSRLWWLGLDGYEPETVHPFLRFAATARVVLDVGAFTGLFSLLATSANPAARVLAFEPHPTVAARLGRNLALNPDREVTVLPYAVGARREVARFHLGGPGLPTSSSLDDAWEGLHRSIDVAVVDLDSVATEWSLEGVDVVKIDVEQREPQVVEGMSRLLAEDRPVIFTEVLPGATDSYAAMSARLLGHDYRLFRLGHGGAVAEAELEAPAAYVDHATTEVNHLACPAEKVPAWLESP